MWWGMDGLRAEKETMSSLPFVCQSGSRPRPRIVSKSTATTAFRLLN